MTIIPAIDIIDGKCVRLTKGDYNTSTIYHEDPLTAASIFEDAGITRLHLVDLDGAKSGVVKNWKVLEKVAGKTSLQIDFSGGISTQTDVITAINAGAAYIAIGSIAVKEESAFTEWIMTFGAERFMVGVDVKNEKVAIRGWTELTDIPVYELIEKYKLKGIRQFFCTDINRDGALQGPAINLYKKIITRVPSIELIASGGVTTLNDLNELREVGCNGAIIGKALYENRISMNDLLRFL